MLEFVEVAMGSGGGVTCGRCARTQRADLRQAFDISAEVEAACAAWGAVPGPNVALTGPDPFGHPALADVLAAARRAGVSRLRLDTDGVRLASPDIADLAVAQGVRHVRVTLLSGSAEEHDALAGGSGASEAALAGVREFLAAAERAGAKALAAAYVPVCRHNVHALPLAVTRAAEAGARYALVEVADPGLDLAAAMPWIGAACDSGTVNSLWVEVAGVPYCLAGGHAVHLVPLMRTPAVGAKGAACDRCDVDRWCGGLHPEAVPQVRAALAPAAVERQLAEAIERAYLAPGPGEGE